MFACITPIMDRQIHIDHSHASFNDLFYVCPITSFIIILLQTISDNISLHVRITITFRLKYFIHYNHFHNHS